MCQVSWKLEADCQKRFVFGSKSKFNFVAFRRKTEPASKRSPSMSDALQGQMKASQHNVSMTTVSQFLDSVVHLIALLVSRNEIRYVSCTPMT